MRSEYNKVQIISLKLKGLYSLTDRIINPLIQCRRWQKSDLRFRNSAFPVPIWGRHNKTKQHKETSVLRSLQLRWTMFLTSKRSIRAHLVSLKQAECCKMPALRVIWLTVFFCLLQSSDNFTIRSDQHLTSFIYYTKQRFTLSSRQAG